MRCLETQDSLGSYQKNRKQNTRHQLFFNKINCIHREYTNSKILSPESLVLSCFSETHWEAFIGKYIQVCKMNQGCLQNQIQCSDIGHAELVDRSHCTITPTSLDFDVIIKPTCYFFWGVGGKLTFIKTKHVKEMKIHEN